MWMNICDLSTTVDEAFVPKMTAANTENVDHTSCTSDLSSRRSTLGETSFSDGASPVSTHQPCSLEDVPWDEEPFHSQSSSIKDELKCYLSKQSQDGNHTIHPTSDNVKCNIHSEVCRSKLISKSKKRERRLVPSLSTVDSPVIENGDLRSVSRTESVRSNASNASIGYLINSTIDVLDDPPQLSSTMSSAWRLRETFKHEPLIPSSKIFEECNELPTAFRITTSPLKSPRKDRTNSKSKQVIRAKLKSRPPENDKSSIDVGLNAEFSIPVMESIVDHVPNIVACHTGNKNESLLDDRSLESFNSTLTPSLASELNFEVIQMKEEIDDSRHSADVSAGCNSGVGNSKRSTTSRRRKLPKKESDVSTAVLAMISPDIENSIQETNSAYALKELMPPTKRKSSKVIRDDKKAQVVNASEILKKKIVLMNEELRLKAFSGHSRTSLPSVDSSDVISENQMSLNSVHSSTSRRTLSCGSDKLHSHLSTLRRKCVDASDTNGNDESRSHPKSVDTSSIPGDQVVLCRRKSVNERRAKLRAMKDDALNFNSEKDDSTPKISSLCEADDNSYPSDMKKPIKVTDATKSINWIATTTETAKSVFSERPVISQEPANHTQVSPRQLSHDTDKEDKIPDTKTPINSASGHIKTPSEMWTQTTKDAIKSSDKIRKEHRALKGPKDERRSSHPKSRTSRLDSSCIPVKGEADPNKTHLVRSRSQSPGRKGKRQPKSLMNPEKLHAWQIRQQLKHRVTPIGSIYNRRLDEDDEDQALSMSLPPAFRHLGRKPKSSRF